MKQFSTLISGHTVTDQNYKEVAKEIKTKYGICPALGSIIFAVAQASLEDTSKTITRKEMESAMNKATKEIGYQPSYFNQKMRTLSQGEE